MVAVVSMLLGSFALAFVVLSIRGDRDSIGRAGRFGLAVLFVVAGVAHFVLIEGMAQMVPPPFPPRLTVWVTGVLEIAGGIGVLIQRTSKVAGVCLFLFLLAVFPANVYAAVHHTGLGGHVEGPAYLLKRAPAQVLFLWWTWHFAVRQRGAKKSPQKN